MLSPYQSWIKVFNDGEVLICEESYNWQRFDKELTFQSEMTFLKNKVFWCLQNNSILTSESQVVFSEKSNVHRNISGYREITLDDNCDPYYSYGVDTAVYASKIKVKTVLTNYNKRGELQFNVDVDGNVDSRFVEKDGFIYIAAMEADSVGNWLVKNKDGFYNDTIKWHKEAVLNLYKVSYSGEVQWKKQISGIQDYYDFHQTKFGATANFLWLFSAYNVVQLDLDGNRINQMCNGNNFNPLQFLSSGVYGSYNTGGTTGVKLLKESFQYKDLPNIAGSGFASEGNSIFSERSDGIIAFDVLNDKITKVYDDAAGGWPFFREITRGCDGSFYSTSVRDNGEDYLFRITKDGKSSY